MKYAIYDINFLYKRYNIKIKRQEYIDKLEGGVYNESIVIEKNVELQGDENDIPIISIESGIVCEVSSCSSFSFIHFDNSNGVEAEDEDLYGINALVKIDCSATFSNCKFSGAFDAMLRIKGVIILCLYKSMDTI